MYQKFPILKLVEIICMPLKHFSVENIKIVITLFGDFCDKIFASEFQNHSKNGQSKKRYDFWLHESESQAQKLFMLSYIRKSLRQNIKL